MRKPLPWAIGWPPLSDMTMETIDPFASRDIAGMSKWRRLLELVAFCADIAATSNRTAAMYFMNDDPSHRGRRPAFSLIEFHQGIGGRSTYRSPAERDFGYLQSISLEDENQLWGKSFQMKGCMK